MFLSQPLTTTDPEIAALIAEERERQEDGIELIASENSVSPGVLEALGSVFTNKYSEGYIAKRYYAGNEVVDKVESLAIERAKALFGAEYVNVQPLSGSPANLAVYMAILSPGDTVLGMSLDHGGHLTHGHPVNFSGMLYNVIPYGLDPETERIDMDEVERLALEHRPKMIIAGYTIYSRLVEWQRFREIADAIGAVLFADISHTAGLIAWGALENPVPICDVVSTTTHKTLRGPRGGMIMAKQQYAKAIAKAVFPGVQGGPHDHVTAAKAVAFLEAAKPEFRQYSKQIILNAQVLADALSKEGFRIVSGGTDTHYFLADVYRNFGIGGKEAEAIFESVGISLNKNMVPNDPRKPVDPSGVRIGTPAVTTRGMREEDMHTIAHIMSEAIRNRQNPQMIATLREQMRTLCRRFPIYENAAA